MAVIFQSGVGLPKQFVKWLVARTTNNFDAKNDKMKAAAILLRRIGFLCLSVLLFSRHTAAFFVPTADVSPLYISKTRGQFFQNLAVRDEVMDVPANDAIPPSSADSSTSLTRIQEEQKGELRFNAEAMLSQIKSLDKNTIINISIFAFALVTVVFQVLSVDIGITRGWSAEEIAYRVPLDNWNSL